MTQSQRCLTTVVVSTVHSWLLNYEIIHVIFISYEILPLWKTIPAVTVLEDAISFKFRAFM